MLELQNGVDAIAIALLILHRIILTNTKNFKYNFQGIRKKNSHRVQSISK